MRVFDIELACQYALLLVVHTHLTPIHPIILVMSESFIKYTIFPNIYKMKVYIFRMDP